MSSAGQQLVAGRIPGERIATAIETTGSADVTTETVVSSVVAPVVDGRIYRVRTCGPVLNDSSNVTSFLVAIREDSISGDRVHQGRFALSGTSGVWHADIEGEYEADATEDKTFVVTLSRTGTGNVQMKATTIDRFYVYVDYIRG